MNRTEKPRRPAWLVASLPGLVWLPLLTTAQAAVLLVPDDYATISAAIAAVQPGDVIRVSESGSPYAEQLLIPDIAGVEYQGGWRSDFVDQNPALYETVIELPADSTGSVLSMGSTPSDVVIDGFTIRGGDTVNGGGIFCGAGSAALIRDCTIRENFASGAGGGIQLANGSAAHLLRCTIEENSATNRGGGIAIAPDADGAVIELCKVRACSTRSAATGGGGGGVFAAGDIRFERNTLRDNVAARNGGGLLARDAVIRAWGNLFYDNEAVFDGGGIYEDNGSGSYSASLVEGCVAGGNGGGIVVNRGTVLFHDGFVRYNTASGSGSLGGGFYFFENMEGCAVRRTEIVGNTAAKGGGIGVQGTVPRAFSFLAIEANSIMGNLATSSGDGAGGIHIEGQFVGSIVNNIVALQESGFGIACNGSDASPTLRFNCVFNDDAVNTDDEYGLNCDDRTGISGNIKQNPVFCCGALCSPPGPPAPDLQLDSVSPCLGAGEVGVDMGAHQGASDCLTPISVEETSWSRIKARYR